MQRHLLETYRQDAGHPASVVRSEQLAREWLAMHAPRLDHVRAAVERFPWTSPEQLELRTPLNELHRAHSRTGRDPEHWLGLFRGSEWAAPQPRGIYAHWARSVGLPVDRVSWENALLFHCATGAVPCGRQVAAALGKPLEGYYTRHLDDKGYGAELGCMLCVARFPACELPEEEKGKREGEETGSGPRFEEEEEKSGAPPLLALPWTEEVDAEYRRAMGAFRQGASLEAHVSSQLIWHQFVSTAVGASTRTGLPSLSAEDPLSLQRFQRSAEAPRRGLEAMGKFTPEQWAAALRPLDSFRDIQGAIRNSTLAQSLQKELRAERVDTSDWSPHSLVKKAYTAHLGEKQGDWSALWTGVGWKLTPAIERAVERSRRNNPRTQDN